jgi:Protein kinase domain
MGVVYRARGPEGEVALKLLLARSTSQEVQRRRFEREVDALRRLDHQGIVAVRGAGQHRDMPWVAMELVEGDSLEQRLARQGPLAPRAAAELIRKLARAVQHAHARGVLHRDLKPANVLLDSLSGEPRLTDFGLARDTDLERSKLTRTGSILGTPGFWPPEQAEGRLEALGPASDVYGLGATLYAALTGQAPFAGESLIECLRAVVELDVVAPSRLAPSLDPTLEAICLRCLEKDPADRYPDAGLLADALDDYCEGAPERAGWRPGVVLAGVALTAALGAILVGALALEPAATLEEPETARPAADPGPGTGGTIPAQPIEETPAPDSPAPDSPAPESPAPSFPGIHVNMNPTGEIHDAAAAGPERVVWNGYQHPGEDDVSVDLVGGDGAPSGVTLHLRGANGQWGTECSHQVMQGYVYNNDRYGRLQGALILDLGGLDAGRYDLVVYAHGAADYECGVFALQVGERTYGVRGTERSPESWRPGPLVEDRHYLVFRDVRVGAGEHVLLGGFRPTHAREVESGVAPLNGLQILPGGSMGPGRPALLEAAGSERLIGVDLGPVGSPVHRGPGVVGAASDRWNACDAGDSWVPLVFADGRGGAGLVRAEDADVEGGGPAAAGDSLAGDAVGRAVDDLRRAAVVFQDLTPGRYDVHVFARTRPGMITAFELATDRARPGIRGLPAVQEGETVISFSDVEVGTALTVSALSPGPGVASLIGGVQLVRRD